MALHRRARGELGGEPNFRQFVYLERRMTEEKVVPEGFPRGEYFGSVPGAQPKLLVRLKQGCYVSSVIPEEVIFQRYLLIEDLAAQLAGYCSRKATQNPSWSMEFNVERTFRGVKRKIAQRAWNVSEAECQWLMQRVRALLSVS